MKKSIAVLLLAVTMSFIDVSRTTAQGSSVAALVTVEFDFIVAGKLLPAGTYQIWSESSDWQMVKIASAGSTLPLVTVKTWPLERTDASDGKVHVQFKNYYGQYFLQWIQLPRSNAHEVKITREQASRVLMRLNLMPPEPADTPK